jgi:hypothetical protein
MSMVEYLFSVFLVGGVALGLLAALTLGRG